MDTFDPISNRNSSIPIMRSECIISMAFWSRANLTHLDWLRNFYVFDFNESLAGESFSLPAPSIKKDSTATSVCCPVFISTPSSANNTYYDESVQRRLLGERECCYVRDNVQIAGHYRGNKQSAVK